MNDSSHSKHNVCVGRAKRSCNSSLLVKFMLAQLQSLGCNISLENKKLVCEPCGKGLLGGFDPIEKTVSTL